MYMHINAYFINFSENHILKSVLKKSYMYKLEYVYLLYIFSKTNFSQWFRIDPIYIAEICSYIKYERDGTPGSWFTRVSKNTPAVVAITFC